MAVVLDELQVKATGNTKSAEKSLDDLIKKLKELQSLSGKTVKETSKLTQEHNKAADAAKKHTNALSKLASSITRIAFYRVIRSAIKAVTQAFSEGIKNAYLWADANGHAFKDVMDTYATRTNYLKNSLGALASTVITALMPAFIKLTNVLVTVINYTNEFIAGIKGVLTGDYSYLRAKEVATEFADATDDAANAQKRLNQQLMKFDELNVITTPKSSGRDDTTNWQDAFEEARFGDLLSTTNLGNLTKVFEEMVRPFKFAWDTIQKIFGYIAQKVEPIKENVKTFIDKFGDAFASINDFSESITDFVLRIVGVVTGQLDVGEYVDGASDIADAVKGIFDKLTSIIRNLEQSGLFDNIATMAGQIADITAKLTIFGTSTALRSIENVLTILDGLLRFDIESILTGFGNEFLNQLGNIAYGIGALVDKLVFWKDTNYANELASFFTRNITDVPGSSVNGSFSGGGSGKTFGTPTRATAGSEAWLIQNGLYASGGFPDMGSVFVAGEIPGQAEMVGNINGRTGVASGEEITGISEAVYSTGGETAALLRELISVCAGNNLGRPNAAFGKYVSQSLRMYKGVTG